MVAHRGGITAGRWAQGLITAYQGAAGPYTYQGAAGPYTYQGAALPYTYRGFTRLWRSISVILETPSSVSSVVAL